MPFHFISLADQGFYRNFDALRNARDAMLQAYGTYGPGGTQAQAKQRLGIEQQQADTGAAAQQATQQYQSGMLGLENRRVGIEGMKAWLPYYGNAANRALYNDIEGITPPGQVSGTGSAGPADLGVTPPGGGSTPPPSGGPTAPNAPSMAPPDLSQDTSPQAKSTNVGGLATGNATGDPRFDNFFTDVSAPIAPTPAPSGQPKASAGGPTHSFDVQPPLPANPSPGGTGLFDTATPGRADLPKVTAPAAAKAQAAANPAIPGGGGSPAPAGIAAGGSTDMPLVPIGAPATPTPSPMLPQGASTAFSATNVPPTADQARQAVISEGWSPDSVDRLAAASQAAPQQVGVAAKAINANPQWRGLGFMELPPDVRAGYIQQIRGAEAAHPNPNRMPLSPEEIGKIYDAHFKLERRPEDIALDTELANSGAPTMTGASRQQKLDALSAYKSGKATNINEGNVQSAVQAALGGDPSKMAGLSKPDYERATALLGQAKELQPPTTPVSEEALNNWRGITTFEKGLNNLEGLLANEKNLGPVLGSIRSANPYDTAARLINNQVTALIPEAERGLFRNNGVIREDQAKEAERMIPGLKTPQDVAKAMIGDFRKRIQTMKEDWYETNAAAGHDVNGFRPMVYPNGQAPGTPPAPSRRGAPGAQPPAPAPLSSAPPAAGGQPVLVTSQAQFDALPPGTRVRDASGNVGTKK